MVRWVVGSILHGVDPLSYFTFHPVLHTTGVTKAVVCAILSVGISVLELTACGACLHPIVSIRDMFRGKNRLSPPEDAVDERLSHGKTGSVHLRTPLMKGYPMEKPAQST